MVVPVDADIAISPFEDGLTPFEIFIYIDFAGFPDFSAITAHKAGIRHATIGMNLFKKPAIERQIEHSAHNTVTAVGFRDTVAMMEKHAFALYFEHEAPVDLHTERFREKIPIGKIVVPAQDMNFAARTYKLAQYEKQLKMIAVHVIAVFVPKFEKVAHYNQVRSPALDGFQELHQGLFTPRNGSRRVYPEMHIGYEVGRHGHRG